MRVGEANIISEPLVVNENESHHSTTAHQAWFDKTVCESLACNGVLQLYFQRIFWLHF